MVNYRLTRFYTIDSVFSDVNEPVYIGATTKKYLSQRMPAYREAYKNFKAGQGPYNGVFDIFNKFGIENCRILLLEKYPCDNINELQAKKQHLIDTTRCVNNNRQVIS